MLTTFYTPGLRLDRSLSLLERSVVVRDVVATQVPLVLHRLVAEVTLQLLTLLVHVLDVLEVHIWSVS